MITWVMVGLLLAAETCGRNVLSGNGNGNEKEETKRREGLKGVSADEEDIYRLTCYTCVNVSDNQMCNEWAIDTPCPAGGRDFCQSMHILDSRGNSVLICISCCDLSYCNIESPTNATNAIYSRKRRAKSKSKRKRPGRNGVDAAMRLYGPSLLWLPASLFYAYHC
ncbi:ly6/PLAUR domain-containing protein 6B isoform X2 [Camponotus floridanus]|uniref:ly6/PLAUR domain-containing protein 6B isoform X2 n=1 Tax=Camponotus floridanus TaxID=104421 RepID=UPI000DC6C31E|nr:ly6/PLAUR domain-containing protein 6B isoform X2 [Camponotus floridanus]